LSEAPKETEAQQVKRLLAKRDIINQRLDEYFNSFHGQFIAASALNIGINIICDSDDSRFRDDIPEPDLEMLRLLSRIMLRGWPFNWSGVKDWGLIEY
jgi:hypothetical protein